MHFIRKASLHTSIIIRVPEIGEHFCQAVTNLLLSIFTSDISITVEMENDHLVAKVKKVVRRASILHPKIQLVQCHSHVRTMMTADTAVAVTVFHFALMPASIDVKISYMPPKNCVAMLDS